MDTRRLEIFCKVIELASFTKAAEALDYSQPTVSEHMRTLEETVGERLIDRLGREVLPTPAGRVFYRYARDIVRLRDEALEAMSRFKQELSGALILGASTIPGTYLLPRWIGTFKGAHPAIDIVLKISDTVGVVGEVVEGSVEAGVVGSPLPERRVVSDELVTDELVLAVYPGHPWGDRGSIDAESLAGEPFVLRERGSGTRMVMNRILEEHRFDPSRLSAVVEMGSTEAVRQGIKARIGVSILSRQAVAEDLQLGTLKEVEIQGVRFQRPLYVVLRKNRQVSPICQAFLAHLRSSVRQEA